MFRQITILALCIVMVLGFTCFAQAEDYSGTYTCSRQNLELKGLAQGYSSMFPGTYPMQITKNSDGSYKVCEGPGLAECDTYRMSGGRYHEDSTLSEAGFSMRMISDATFSNKQWTVRSTATFSGGEIKATYICR
ncbi:hypothetical protein [Desulfovibrio sp. JC022]|uniref:hypothetical protein n=1 Tax=Desulfovibrio sp. JC022 TaxID=2593642 RepID=UPI0013D196E2|nr:hypothetical protein [Desulfovibrio sp. JC022]NDV22655.1 hypothetical protein [Desulfovibrio sp. JC022]